jgi:hypothetical protein
MIGKNEGESEELSPYIYWYYYFKQNEKFTSVVTVLKYFCVLEETPSSLLWKVFDIFAKTVAVRQLDYYLTQ